MKVKILFLLLMVIAVLSIASQTRACQVDVNVAINDYSGQALKGAKFAVYEQLVDAQDEVVSGNLLGSGQTDKNTGQGFVTLTLTNESVAPYAVKVTNPNFEGYDFWYFNQLTLSCGQTADFSVNLSAIKVKVSDYQGLLQKNIKYTIFAQGRDANSEPILLKQIGAGDTGSTGEQVVYLPEPLGVPGLNVAHYALEVKNTKGGKFYKYNISPTAGKLLALNFRFSDLVVNAKDLGTGAGLPNIKLNMFERLPGDTGGYKTGKAITTLQTNESGMAYLQYPAGHYILQFTKSSGEKINFYDIEIKSEERATYNLGLEDYSQAKCAIRSALTVQLRDLADKIIGNINFNLYEQNLDNDGWPIAGTKIGGGRLDKDGLSKINIYPQPAKQYMLEVCDQSNVYGCFWFKNINLECREDLTLFQTLKSVDIILRDKKKQLVPGQKFKIYVAQKNVDGQTVLDKAKLVNSFTMPTSGAYRLYLDNQQINGESLRYLLAVDIAGKEVFAEFAVNDSKLTALEYVIDEVLQPYAQVSGGGNAQVASGVVGKILLQVQANGEAWYVNPANRLRYFLNRPDDAFRIMKNLSVGITNADLAKIRPNVDNVFSADTDSDSDGLSDVLEEALLTNESSDDSDGDGYDDAQELKNGFNPLGAGAGQFNEAFARQNAGRILLQVEGKGEAWYVNPNNLQRYYLGRPKDAFAIMQNLGLGISDADLSKISIGS